MFNLKDSNTKICNDSSTIYYGDSSYITSVKWEDFMNDPEKYLKKAHEIQTNITSYQIAKDV